jgi:hypothetical protein
MMLYPEVSALREIGAMLAAFAVGAPVGLVCYRRLERLSEKGRAGRFVAQFCAWWLGLGAGIAAAVAVAGVYVFAGLVHGVWVTDPLTLAEGLGISGGMAMLYSLFGLFPPATRHEDSSSRPDV